MSDNFLREVDEEVHRDRIAELWRRYNVVIIGTLVLVVAGVAGWRFWEHRQQQAAYAVSARLEQALKASREQRGEDAEKELAAIAAQDVAGYRLVARFRLAAEAARRDGDEGVKLYDALNADASVPPLLRDLARLRAAIIRVDALAYDAFRPQIEPLAAPESAFRHNARELLGLSALRAGNFDEAGRWFDQIVVDQATPQALRQRVDSYLALVRAGPVATN
jgi:hypothetical protein